MKFEPGDADTKLRTIALVEAMIRSDEEALGALFTVRDNSDLFRLVMDLVAFSATSITMLADEMDTDWQRILESLREGVIEGEATT